MSGVNRMLGRWGKYLLSVRRHEAESYRYAKQFEERMNASEEEIRRLQWERLKEILTTAYRFSPYYQRRFDEVGFTPDDFTDFSDLQKLPELTRTHLREHLDDIVTVNVSPQAREKSSSGGTTGKQLSFYRDSYCRNYRRGIDLALARYYGWKDGDWQGLLWGAPQDLFMPHGWKQKFVQQWGSRVYALDYNRLSDATYEKFVRKTNRYRPSFILGYPSLAFDLAERIEAGRVSPMRVPVINVTAEPLYEDQRHKIEEVIADKVYARYGAREFGTIAFECPEQKGLHIIPESVYVEVVPLKDGSNTGYILVTDLLNRCMPLIRYRIGDIVDYDETPCTCGLRTPRLLHIQGRETDILWRPDGTGVAGLRVHGMGEEAGLTTHVQIIQEALDEVIILIENTGNEYIQQAQRLLEIFKRKLSADIHYHIKYVEKIKRSPSGKYRYVISHVKQSEIWR